MSETLWFDRSDAVRFLMNGEDAKDLLHRLSTNDVQSLVPWRGTATLLLERSGRLIDRLVVLDRGEDLLLLGSPGRAEVVRDWLEKLTILEDARLQDVSGETAEFLVIGGGATKAVSTACDVEAASLARYAGAPIGASVPDGTVVRIEDHGGPAFAIVVPLEAADRVASQLAPARGGSEEELRRLRTSFGVATWGAELDERTLPLEARLVDAISFTKGCYIGQEVIARVHHHKRVKRMLARLAVDGSPPMVGSAVLASHAGASNEPPALQPIGRITSAAPDGTRSLALAYVETGWDAPGRRVAVADATDPNAVPREAEVLPLTPEGDPRWPS